METIKPSPNRRELNTPDARLVLDNLLHELTTSSQLITWSTNVNNQTPQRHTLNFSTDESGIFKYPKVKVDTSSIIFTLSPITQFEVTPDSYEHHTGTIQLGQDAPLEVTTLSFPLSSDTVGSITFIKV